MKIYCDMEFTGLRKDTSLISIGITADDGRVFYAESNEYSLDAEDVTKEDKLWLEDNVIPYLLYHNEKESYMSGSISNDLMHIPNQMEYLMKGSLKDIRSALKVWLDIYEEITFVGDVLAYDWVLFCDILGKTAKDLPNHVSYTPIDISTLMYAVGLDPVDITRAEYVDVVDINQGKVWQKQHNALYDALIIKKIYKKLTNKLNVIKKSSNSLDKILVAIDKNNMSNHVIIPESEMRDILQIIDLKKSI